MNDREKTSQGITVKDCGSASFGDPFSPYSRYWWNSLDEVLLAPSSLRIRLSSNLVDAMVRLKDLATSQVNSR